MRQAAGFANGIENLLGAWPLKSLWVKLALFLASGCPMKFKTLLIPLVLALTACAGTPIEVTPVTNFEQEKYLGTWYEIARLDHSFERGLSNVTATYTRRDDGKITVLNRGFNDKKETYKTAKGKAKFAQGPSIGHLKVSFFGPFYGDYIIFGLDDAGYTNAFVSGGKDNYLWLLSRTPTISQSVREDFLNQSRKLGYNIDAILWVDQSRNN